LNSDVNKHTIKRILEMISVQKGAFITAPGKVSWAERGACLLNEAGGYMLSAQGEGMCREY